MQENYQHYLQEMGIEQWTVSHPERLSAYQPQSYAVDSHCRLLFVCPRLPQGNEARFLNKITRSFHVDISHVQHVYPHDLSLIVTDNVEWIWFCGCHPVRDTVPAVKRLVSPFLSEIDGNTENRRALWSQICACQKG